jgi:hypothetical protein
VLLELIATIALGLGAGGLLLGLARITGGRLPRWVAPVAGGAAMFAFMLWNEYTWYERAVAGLPEGARVAESYSHASWLQPWTVAVPRIARFAAVVPPEEEAGAAPAGALRADVLLVARFEPVLRLPHLFDCAAGRRVALPGREMAADPARLDWTAPGPDDPLLRAACTGPA